MSTAESDGSGRSIRAVSRAIQVLSAFRGGVQSLSVGELVRDTGLPRTTVLRLVDTLAAEGMLQADASGRIRPGAGLIAWAAMADDVWRVPDPAVARMQQLADESGETVSYYVRSAADRRVLAQAQPSANRLRHVVEVGDTLPLWGGAAAMVLLAQASADERDRLIALAAGSAGSPFTAVEIAARVEEARTSGFAVSHGLREVGNSGAAVPILDRDGMPLPIAAALAVGGPTSRFHDDAVERFRSLLEAGARQVRDAGLPVALQSFGA